MTLHRLLLFLTVLLPGLVLALSAQAIPMDTMSEKLTEEENLLLIPSRLWSHSDRAVFDPVLTALENGNMQAAKKALEPLKAEHPSLAGTWELDGVIKLASGDPKGAEVSLRRAMDLVPEIGSIYAKLGAALLAQNKVTEAERALTKALELDGQNVFASLLLGRIEAAQGKIAPAMAHYRAAVSASEGFSPGHRELAELYLRGGDARKALKLIEPLLEGAAPGPFLIAARAYIALNEGDKAREMLTDARELGVDTAEARLYEAVLQRLENNFTQSENRLRKLVDQYPERPLLLLELATTYAAAGKHEDSRITAVRGVELLPEGHSARIDFANLLLSQGFASEALKAVQFSIESRVSDPQALLIAARSGLVAGNLEAADAASSRLLSDFPRLSEAFTHRTEVLLRQGKADQALTVAQSGTETLPQKADVWTTRVSLMLRQGLYKGAVQTAKDGLGFHTDNTLLKLQLANALQEAGQTGDAESLYRELSQDKETAVIALNNLANLLAEDPNRRDEALEYAQRARDMAPESAAVNDTLGWILHLDGLHDEAQTFLDIARAAAPDDPGVLCRLGIVSATINGIHATREKLEQCASQENYPDLSARATALLRGE